VAHPEQNAFVRAVKARFPVYFAGTRVLEIGSRNVNGSIRQFFRGCEYVGLDCQPGCCVDVVNLAHEFADPDPFDVVVSCEAFEHDPHFDRTIPHVLGLLRRGGLFVATWASPLRPEHGTAGTGEIYGPDPAYYRGIAADEFIMAAAGMLHLLETSTARDGQDVRAVGFRAATTGQ
jgi:SAM-dependent methyltransferase